MLDKAIHSGTLVTLSITLHQQWILQTCGCIALDSHWLLFTQYKTA